jgi:hypothetical protein
VQPKIIDQFSDPSFRKLAQIIRRHPETQELIKTAEMDPEANGQRPSSAFADSVNRRFPIDTPDHAVLSRLYMEKQAGVSPEVLDACDKALDLYGVELDLEEKLATTKAAAPFDPDDYLLPEIRRMVVKTAEDVATAADVICQNHRTFDIDSRARACTRLVKKAADHGVPLPPDILKFAGVTMCDVPTLRDWIGARAAATTDPTIRWGYDKLASELESFPALCGDRDELIKVAAAIGELDEAAGLGQHYDRRLPDPLRTVFNTTKVADDMLELAGAQVPVDQLLSIPPEIYQDVFGEDLAAEFVGPDGDIDVEQMKVILPTVPYDLQKALAAQMGA